MYAMAGQAVKLLHHVPTDVPQSQSRGSDV
jgi:hypothetical protein